MLPAELASWESVLGLLPPDIARSLGPWVDALTRALGPLKARAREGVGAPDGWDGITTRAPFDRLLLTEWALAEEVPEEFLRKATSGELLFSQLARREEARARTSVALFDPGPMQVGRPRIGQLVTLLTLASRAERAGAKFGWASLQSGSETEAALKLGVTRDNLRGFLLGRMAFAPTPDNVQRWIDLARTGAWEDLWVIGPKWVVAPGLRVQGVKTPVGRIEISESSDGKTLTLTVSRGALVRSVTLPLPTDLMCLRLLRDGELAPLPMTSRPTVPGPPPAPKPPVDERRAVHHTAGLMTPSFFLADGRKLAGLQSNGRIAVYTLPDAPVSKKTRVRTFDAPPRSRVHAVGWAKKRLHVLYARGEELFLAEDHGHALHDDGVVVKSDGTEAFTASLFPTKLTRMEVLARGSNPVEVFVRDNRRRLWRVVKKVATLVETGVDDFLAGERLWVVTSNTTPLTQDPSIVRVVRAEEGHRLVLGSGASAWVYHVTEEACFVTGAWTVQTTPGTEMKIPIRHDDWVINIGPALHRELRGGICAIVQSEERGPVSLVTATERIVSMTPQLRATDITVAARGDRVAFHEDDEDVEVWDVLRAQRLLRIEAHG